jgi:hypothetical protein
VSTFTLQGNSHLAVPYNAPFFGSVHYEVEAERPITLIVVDDVNLAAWRAGYPYNPIGGTAEVTRFQQDLFIPRNTRWYLVMVNYSPFPTAVWYNVRS